MMNDLLTESTGTDPALVGHAREPRNHAGSDKFVVRCSLLRGTSKQLIVDAFTMSHQSASSVFTTEFPAGVGSKPPGEPSTICVTPLPCSLDLRLIVSRQIGPHHFVPTAKTRSQSPRGRVTRNMKSVPPTADRVLLRTGDRIGIGVGIDPPGFLSAFNVGPAGRSNVFYLDADLQQENQPRPIEPNRPLHILDVVTTAPTGRERLFAVWSRQPLPLRLDQLQSLVGQNEGRSPPSRPYVATRDMMRLPDLVHQSQPESRHVVVVEVDLVK